jgi:hypothetical protein
MLLPSSDYVSPKRLYSPITLHHHHHIIIIIIIIISGVKLSPLGTTANIGLLYQHQMIDDGDCGAIGGIRIGRGNRNTQRKPAPVPHCPP